MELAIEPEPSAEERAAIVAGLERAGVLDGPAESEWARSELEDELPERPATA